MASEGPLLGARREENLHLGLGEYHGAHIAPVRHQTRGYGESAAGAPGARPAPPGRAATLEASLPACSVRMSRVTSSPSSQTTSSPCGSDPKRMSRRSARRRKAARVVQADARPARAPARPAGTGRRYRASAQPRALAAARLMVPLPDPEGPSMVMTGTAVIAAALRRRLGRWSRPDRPRQRRRNPERRSRHWPHRGSQIGCRGAQAGDAEGHGDAMIAAAVDLTAAESRPVRRGPRSACRPAAPRARRPSASKPGAHGGDPIALLDAQFLRARDHGLARARRRRR